MKEDENNNNISVSSDKEKKHRLVEVSVALLSVCHSSALVWPFVSEQANMTWTQEEEEEVVQRIESPRTISLWALCVE